MKEKTAVISGCKLAVVAITVCIIFGCQQSTTQPSETQVSEVETKVVDPRATEEATSKMNQLAKNDGVEVSHNLANANAGDLAEAALDEDIELSANVEFPDEDEPVDAPEVQTIDIPESWTRVGKDYEIWIDKDAKKVIVAGHVVLQAGPLEMFICPRRTKEHESVISVNASSKLVHASLIAIGASPGKPVEWEPRYKPASGPIIDITVSWKEGDKVVSRRGQEMVRNFKTAKALEHDWVFGGSQIYETEETGQVFYYGDAGALACVSNFSTATMDLNIESSKADGNLLFEAFTENIPEVATKVYVEFKPRQD